MIIKSPLSYDKPIVNNLTISICPDVIRDAVADYGKRRSLSWDDAYSSILHDIEMTEGVSLRQMARDYSYRLGGGITIGYLIANNNELLRLFTELVNADYEAGGEV